MVLITPNLHNKDPFRRDSTIRIHPYFIRKYGLNTEYGNEPLKWALIRIPQIAVF